MKIVKNHALQEGVLLLALGGALNWYSLDGYARAFNKDWSQSPYLFPIILAVILYLLALTLLVKGLLDLKKDVQAEKKTGSRAGTLRVLAMIGISLLYYAVLAMLKLPYMAVNLAGLTLRFSTFEAATLVFIAGMMAYMGVRKWQLLTFVPIGATLFLSVIFRSLLHVILP